MLTTAVAENAYDLALENFDTAADSLELNQDIRAMIKYPERVLTVSVPVRMDEAIFAGLRPTGRSTVRCAVRRKAASVITRRSRSTK